MAPLADAWTALLCNQNASAYSRDMLRDFVVNGAKLNSADTLLARIQELNRIEEPSQAKETMSAFTKKDVNWNTLLFDLHTELKGETYVLPRR